MFRILFLLANVFPSFNVVTMFFFPFYVFLVAQGTKTQLRKSNSLPSIEAYAIDDDHNCDDVILYTHIDSEGVRYAANKEISGSASITLVCPGVPGHNQSSCAFSKSPSSVQLISLFHFYFVYVMSSIYTGLLILELLQNEAAVSDADESLQESSPSTSAADIAEDSGTFLFHYNFSILECICCLLTCDKAFQYAYCSLT